MVVFIIVVIVDVLVKVVVLVVRVVVVIILNLVGAIFMKSIEHNLYHMGSIFVIHGIFSCN